VWREVADDARRVVQLESQPQRVVSLVPNLTELVCALGAGNALIGATRFCTEPRGALAGVVRVGGTKTPACDRILALRPDLVLVNSEENRDADFDYLTSRRIPVFVSFPVSVRDAAVSVRRLGWALGAETEAAALADAIETGLCAPPSWRRRVFCPIWRRPWMSFNAATYCGDLLACAGGQSVSAASEQRYPVVDLRRIAAGDPEVILLPDEPYPFAEKHFAALAPLYGSTAWRRGRVHLIDGKALSWYGPRTPGALVHLQTLLRAP
jgi:ABC-type Fe3+-hydroxamate transport system substrate-binding protein